MDMKELWEKACAVMQAEINQVLYNTFIANNLTPMALEGDTLLMTAALENMIPMTLEHYQTRIEEALSQVSNKRMKIKLLTNAEWLRHKEQPEEQKQDAILSSIIPLNPKYTFDTFVVGSNNAFAHAAALAVAHAPAQAYNPLFIYGGVGLGKTHLVHAVGHAISEQWPDKRILYIPGEAFTNELITAIQQNRNLQFRNRFRNVDVLMVDDIQFIAGKESTQEEFFHTFNTLHTAGKQIILTSDRPPQEIARLEERLRSRFSGGLLADVKKPDIETRIAILRKKAEQEHIPVEDEVLTTIADHVDSNIRELEGSLTRLVAYANLTGKPISLTLCNEALRDLFANQTRKEITAQVIMQSVAEYYSITVDDLIRPIRRREIAIPRQIAMYLTRELTNLSLPQIGQVFGNRDHTTVLHGCNQIGTALKREDREMVNAVKDLKNILADGR